VGLESIRLPVLCHFPDLITDRSNRNPVSVADVCKQGIECSIGMAILCFMASVSSASTISEGTAIWSFMRESPFGVGGK
jgi:hypothetical protein